MVQHPFKGFRDRKAYAMSLAGNDRVLELDPDERVSEKMRESIRRLGEDYFSRHAGFEFPRLTRFYGKMERGERP